MICRRAAGDGIRDRRPVAIKGVHVTAALSIPARIPLSAETQVIRGNECVWFRKAITRS